MPAAVMAAYKVKHASIHEAVKKLDVFEVELMVKNGASVNEVEAVDQFTPLHTACNVGALECVHWLLWHGADTTVTTTRGWTPAHIAAIRGHNGCVQALANNNANMNAPDTRGHTPTHLAATHGNSFVLSSILRTGVDVNCLDKNGWTPIHAACYHGRLGCVQLLVRWGGAKEEVDNSGNTPAHLAAQEGHLSCLKYVVSVGSSPERILGARNDNGETPRDLALQFYKQNIIDYIDNIEQERDTPIDEQSMSFPAHLAAYTGDLEHLRMLVENGVVNINERDNKRSTPAHKGYFPSIFHDSRKKPAEFLLKLLSPQMLNYLATELVEASMAAGNGHIHILRWLIEMGADTKLANQAGETPTDVARRFAQLACIKLLGGDNDENEDMYGDDTSDDVPDNTKDAAAELTAQQRKHARGRAKKRVEELERLMDIAKKNFAQLGGKLPEDVKRLTELQEKDQTIQELEAQLDYERLKREKLEAQLDQFKRELGRVKSERVDSARSDVSDDKDSKNKKKPRKPRSYGDDGVFIKRNFTAPLKTKNKKL